MEKKEALGIIERVCTTFRGTLQEHQAIQSALTVLKTKCIEKKEIKKK